MRQASKRPAGTGRRVPRGAIRFLNLRLDEFVAPSITEGGERRFQAFVLRCFLAVALAMAASAPVLLAMGNSASVTAFPLILAAVALASAAFLSIAGRPDAVLWFWGTIVSVGLALAAQGNPEMANFATVILAVLPLEAAAAGRFRLAGGLAVVSLACGSLLLAGGLGLSHLPAGETALGLLVLFYGLRFASLRRHPARTGLPEGRTGGFSERSACRRAAESFGAMMFEVSQGGRIDHASTAAAGAMAGPSWGCPGELFGELCHVADRLSVMQAIDAARAGGAPGQVEARLKVADGGFDRFVLTIGRLEEADDSGKSAPVVTIALAAASDGAVNADCDLETVKEASAAKSRFLATVSHELRTPLNAIIGFSDVLDQEYFGGFESSKQKEYVGLIRQSGEHLLSIVNTLLDVSKIEAGRYELDPEPFELSALMTEVGDFMREEARRKGLRLDVRSGAGVTLVADRRACRQILLNLVANALKFTEAGAVTLESRVRNGFCELLVSDTGIGIAEADIARLGIPFVQVSSGLSRRYEGTGLGLSLVKGLAELHGGGMTVESQPGVGTMVTIRLPAAGSPAAEDPSDSPQEKIVALSDARSKTNSQTQNREKRRSA
ncbi:sensor histidine kinase [Jiella avicenniae]|uniref:histidine kinase n=1 Tax=Jiella avicenniae TaxID=2907202 RepID=A0A9X1NYD9_9HYPH|nr:PAS domain-containing sensor histidine kinase [Jiella avicenniae]MCE7026579.1 PAS domain-containing sensor histidine kinase [Jiella avicenniae]